MNTLILTWNTYFSSYKLDRFFGDFHFPAGKDILTDADNWDRSPDHFNWSIADYPNAHAGDRFFFIRVGYEKPTGIVGVGHFTSEPYEDIDWSGQDHPTRYMDMDFETIVNPTTDKVLPTAKLATAIPEIDWTRGKSGRIVSPEIASKLEELWRRHLESNT